MAKKDKKLWSHDLLHFGQICEYVRESRGITQEQISEYSGVRPYAISRLERGSASNSTLNSYVSALQSDLVPRRSLTNEQARILRELYTCSKEVRKQEINLTAIGFQDILPGRRPKLLNDLVYQLEQEDRPAFIMDSLWFIHAFNGAVLHLFGLDQKSEFLQRWTAWHVLGVKFDADSPVRSAHFNPDEYFPPTVALFCLDKRTYPYLFTAQMRCLIKRLDALSEQNKLKFTQWWLQAISFDLGYDLDCLTRTIWYEGEKINTEAHQRMETEIQMVPGQRVSYTLAVWDPIGSDSRRVFEKIRRLPDSHDIVFAAHYDKNRDFHANNWKEVEDLLSPD